MSRPIRPIRSIAKRRALGIVLLAIVSGLSSCEARGPFGYPEPAFKSIVRQGDRAAVVALPATAFDDPGPDGPAAWYYTALWLQEGPPKADPAFGAASHRLVLDLFGRAAAKARGFVREDARARLVRALLADARIAGAGSAEAWQAVLDAAGRDDSNEEIVSARIEALASLSDWSDLLAASSSLLHGDIGHLPANDGAALYAKALAAKSLGLPEAGPDLAELLSLGTGPWVAKGLDLLPGRNASGPVPASLVAKAGLFQAIEARDYAAAWRASQGVLPELRESPTRELVGAVGKAWLFSGMARNGIALMESVIGSDGAANEAGSPAWAASFYKARMLAALSRYDEAATLFESLVGGAVSDTDADSCLWYALDARLRAIDSKAPPLAAWESGAARDRALAVAKLEAMTGTAKRWHHPGTFSDLVEPQYRALVADGDWDELDELADRIAPHASPGLAARLLYISGRARELGLVGETPSQPLALARAAQVETGPATSTGLEVAALRYRAVLELDRPPEYYLLAASARLGIDVEPWNAREKPYAVGPLAPTAPAEDLAAAAKGLVENGLPDLAWELAGSDTDGIADRDLVDLAKACAREGSYVSSMRFADSLAARSDAAYEGLATGVKVNAPDRSLFKLLYPRPWLGEVDIALRGSEIPKSAAYGLIRSESWFDPDVRSVAGAVGLSQMMPSTAAEIARNLGMKRWSLENPADNIRLGMAMLRDLVDRNDGHLLRAAFAYNAGPSRLRHWLAESGGYPDDLFLERLSIAETRDYGRKIVTATTWYAALYEGKGSADTVRKLFSGYSMSF